MPARAPRPGGVGLGGAGRGARRLRRGHGHGHGHGAGVREGGLPAPAGLGGRGVVAPGSPRAPPPSPRPLGAAAGRQSAGSVGMGWRGWGGSFSFSLFCKVGDGRGVVLCRAPVQHCRGLSACGGREPGAALPVVPPRLPVSAFIHSLAWAGGRGPGGVVEGLSGVRWRGAKSNNTGRVFFSESLWPWAAK